VPRPLHAGRQADDGRRRAGGGIDVAAFVEGANVADANGWTCGGIVYSTDDKFDVLSTMLQAGGGKPMRLGALISCYVSTPRVSLATLTGADVIGEAVIPAGRARRDRINAVAPRLPQRGPRLGHRRRRAHHCRRLRHCRRRPAHQGGHLRPGADTDQLGQLAAYDIVNPRVRPRQPAVQAGLVRLQARRLHHRRRAGIRP
jgi:hypothetical protein